jgi:hypothetical protein
MKLDSSYFIFVYVSDSAKSGTILAIVLMTSLRINLSEEENVTPHFLI